MTCVRFLPLIPSLTDRFLKDSVQLLYELRTNLMCENASLDIPRHFNFHIRV